MAAKKAKKAADTVVKAKGGGNGQAQDGDASL